MFRPYRDNAEDFPRKRSFPIQAQAHPAHINQGSISYAVLGCGPFCQPISGFSQSMIVWIFRGFFGNPATKDFV